MDVTLTKPERHCLDEIAMHYGFVCLEKNIDDKASCESLVQKGLLERRYFASVPNGYQGGTYIGFNDKAIFIYFQAKCVH